MAEKEQTAWGIHAGRTGDAHSLFLNKGCVAVGWNRMGDLSKIRPDREAFKARVAEVYPGMKEGAVPGSAGQMFRFVYEMKEGDIVIYPSKLDRQIHLGRVDGPYRYDPTTAPGYPDTRPVKWLKSLPRTHFTQGALHEVGSAMSFFQVKTYADEYLAALRGGVAAPPVETDETVAQVSEEIEETTNDSILKRLSQELKGHPLSDFVGHLLNCMGYRTRISPPGPDGGIDIIAHKDELGFEPPIVKVQVKSTDGSIGDPVVSTLYGKVSAGEFGLFVTLGTFTNQAKAFARGKSNLRLIDGQELVGLILQHYDQFESRYKGLLPLKRVWVPEALADSSD
jgi:restriction system protein